MYIRELLIRFLQKSNPENATIFRPKREPLNSVVRLVGADMTINSGSFALLASLPTIAVRVPSDEAELFHKGVSLEVIV